MFIELALTQHDITNKDIQRASFTCIEKGIDVLSVPIVHLTDAKQYLENTSVKLAASLDCPYGQNPTELRHAGIILAERRGASIIELGVNMGWIKDDKINNIKTDIKTCISVCNQKKLELRILLEYRVFTEEQLITYCDFFHELGVSAIISSFGTVMDDVLDNIIMGQKLEKKYKYICSSNLWKPKDVELAKASKIKRIRFLSTGCLERCIII